MHWKISYLRTIIKRSYDLSLRKKDNKKLIVVKARNIRLWCKQSHISICLRAHCQLYIYLQTLMFVLVTDLHREYSLGIVSCTYPVFPASLRSVSLHRSGFDCFARSEITRPNESHWVTWFSPPTTLDNFFFPLSYKKVDIPCWLFLPQEFRLWWWCPLNELATR